MSLKSDDSFDSNIDLEESEEEQEKSTKIWGGGQTQLKKDFSSMLKRELQKGELGKKVLAEAAKNEQHKTEE